MKGILPKRVVATTLQCAKCVHFMDNDPDVFYCALDRPEFAALCVEYQYRYNTYQVLDEEDGGLD